MENLNIPQHVAIILDGNGRWAKKRHLPRNMGHRQGSKVVEQIIEDAHDLGINYLTVYAFSTENWKRPKEEVDAIMDLLWQYLNDCDEYLEQEVRMIFFGDMSRLPERIQKRMLELEADSAKYHKMNLLLAINYGGRDEIKHATQLIAEEVQAGKLQISDITEDTISQHLYTKEVPDVDLLIRPSG